MVKRLLSAGLAVVVLSSATITAGAMNTSNDTNPGVSAVNIEPKSSKYLSSYSIALVAKDNCRMSVTMDVSGVRTMDKIGCMMLVIEKKVGNTWYEVETLLGIENPDEFYFYDSADYFYGISFYGEAGISYRVTMTAYAKDSTGFDTGEVTSYTVTCRN